MQRRSFVSRIPGDSSAQRSILAPAEKEYNPKREKRQRCIQTHVLKRMRVRWREDDAKHSHTASQMKPQTMLAEF
eukprot:3728717-Pleurochrysis_carterae.AAC.4